MELLRAQVDFFNRLYWVMSGEFMLMKLCPVCNRETEGYSHEADGCGVCNRVQCDVDHHHFYCKCGHEWVTT